MARKLSAHIKSASEESDESEGGVPLWTPASTVFTDPNVLAATSQRAEPQMQDFEASDSPTPKIESSAVDRKSLIRHRHTLGSSLNAMTAPFVPSVSVAAHSTNSALMRSQIRVTRDAEAYSYNTTDNTTKTRPASKSFHQGSSAQKAGVPFPFTKRPSIPELKEFLACRSAQTHRGKSYYASSVQEHQDYPVETRAIVDDNHTLAACEHPGEEAAQAMVVHGVHPNHVAEHRLRIFATVSEETKRSRSDALNWLTSTGVPQERILLDPSYLPFMESATQHSPAEYAVVQISNIPYGVSRSEISALMGRNSRQIADYLEGIHIIMTRIDGKTHDAFVEVENLSAAMSIVSRLENGSDSRGPRLGDRQVAVSLSSQAALMKALFPNARGVRWNEARPEFPYQPDDQPWKHFKGFLTSEELSMLVKHVESPQRAPFSTNCPERPYENFISVLKKFPWNETEYITINTQHIMYSTSCQLIEVLRERLDRGGPSAQRLTQQLLTRLVTACLLCPGFTVLQKDNMMVTASWDPADLAGLPVYQPRFAECWRHQYTLCPVPGTPFDLLEFYIGIIREETCSVVHNLPLEESRKLTTRASRTSDYWGYFWREVGYPSDGSGQDFDNMTLAEAARLEWAAIDRSLRRAVRPATTH